MGSISSAMTGTYAYSNQLIIAYDKISPMNAQAEASGRTVQLLDPDSSLAGVAILVSSACYFLLSLPIPRPCLQGQG